MTFKELLEKKVVEASTFVEAMVELQKVSISKLEVMCTYAQVEIEKCSSFIALMLDSGLSFDEVQNKYKILDDEEYKRVCTSHEKGNKSAVEFLKEKGVLVEENYSDVSDKEVSKSQGDSSEQEGAVSSAAYESMKELVENGTLDASVLDEFTSENKQESEIKSQTKDSSSNIIDLSTMTSKEALDESFIDSLLEITQKDQIKHLFESLISIKQNMSQKDIAESEFDKLTHFLQMLKGTARLVGAKLFEEMLERISGDIRHYSSRWENFDSNKREEITSILEADLKALISFVKVLCQYQNESKVLELENVKDSVINIFQREVA